MRAFPGSMCILNAAQTCAVCTLSSQNTWPAAQPTTLVMYSQHTSLTASFCSPAAADLLCLQHSFSGLMGYIITADAVIKLFELGAAGPIRYQVGLMLCPSHTMCCQDCLCFLYSLSHCW